MSRKLLVSVYFVIAEFSHGVWQSAFAFQNRKEITEDNKEQASENVKAMYEAFKRAWSSKNLPTPRYAASSEKAADGSNAKVHLVDQQHIVIHSEENLEELRFAPGKWTKRMQSAYVVPPKMVDDINQACPDYKIPTDEKGSKLLGLFKYILIVFARNNFEVNYFSELDPSDEDERLVVEVQTQIAHRGEIDFFPFKKETFGALKVIVQKKRENPKIFHWRDATLRIVCYLNPRGKMEIATAYPIVPGE